MVGSAIPIATDGSFVGDRFSVSGTSAVQRWWPALAFSDSNCLVVWEQGTSRDVYGNVDVRVTGVTEPSPAPAIQRSKRPSVVSDGLPDHVSLYDALGRCSQALKPGVYFTREAGQTGKILRVRQPLNICFRGSGMAWAVVLSRASSCEWAPGRYVTKAMPPRNTRRQWWAIRKTTSSCPFWLSS